MAETDEISGCYVYEEDNYNWPLGDKMERRKSRGIIKGVPTIIFRCIGNKK